MYKAGLPSVHSIPFPGRSATRHTALDDLRFFYRPGKEEVMLHYKIIKDENGEDVYVIDTSGVEILHNTILNKGSAFSYEERELF